MTARIVPAIDLIDGRCVRLERGAFGSEKVIGGDPVDIACNFEGQGFGRLHLVDLDGAKAGAPRHLKVLERICEKTSLQVDFSGGLRTESDLAAAMEAGASQVCIGSAAVKSRQVCERWFECFGGARLILGLDVLDGLVKISGWQESTQLTLDEVVDWYLPRGLQMLMSTDISRDGMLTGPAFSHYQRLSASYPGLTLIASGGVSSGRDVRELSLDGVQEIIIGKALYEGLIDLDSVSEFIW